MKNNLVSGGFKEGASTITQQLVKNTHLKNDKTLKRKVQEIRIAKSIERNYDKDKILENYLNILYFAIKVFSILSSDVSSNNSLLKTYISSKIMIKANSTQTNHVGGD